jgi:hypothetical protein
MSLSDFEKQALVEAHEDGVPADDLAEEYGISVPSVAAFVANAHRNTSVFDCSTKREHRQKIWMTMLKELARRGTPSRSVRAMYLAGDRPHETELLLKNGILPANLYPVEADQKTCLKFLRSVRKFCGASIAAHVEARLMVGNLSVAEPPVPIDALFFDACAPIGPLETGAVFPELQAVVSGKLLNDVSTVTVAVARGHDRGVSTDAQRESRILKALSRLPGRVEPISDLRGMYKNSLSKGNLTFFYVGFVLTKGTKR